MALLHELFSRQLRVSGNRGVPLHWMLQDLRCHYQDEVFLRGGLTGVPVPPFACKFTPDGLHGNLLAVADEEGSVRLMDTRKHVSSSLVTELHAHSNAIFDMAWLPGGTKLVTASGDTSLRLWDIVGSCLLSTFKAHTGSVKAVDVKMDDPSVIVSGGRDGSVLLWDMRCSTRGSRHKPVNCISMAHKRVDPGVSSGSARKRNTRSHRASPSQKRLTVSDSQQNSVTAVLFHGDHTVATAGSADGVVKLWDLRRSYTGHKRQPPTPFLSFAPTGEPNRPFGFTSLVSDPFQSQLFASCTNDIIYTYDSSGLNKYPVKAFSGHQNATFYIKSAISYDGRYLLSGSSCGNAFIWEVAKPENPPLILSGHQNEVTAVNWCPTQIDKVVTCSDNDDVRLWRVVRQAGSAPGEYIGSCEVYSGDGHMKAVKEVRKLLHAQDTGRRTAPVELQNLRKGVTTLKQGSSPPTGPTRQQKVPLGLLRFVSRSETLKENSTVQRGHKSATLELETTCCSAQQETCQSGRTSSTGINVRPISGRLLSSPSSATMSGAREITAILTQRSTSVAHPSTSPSPILRTSIRHNSPLGGTGHPIPAHISTEPSTASVESTVSHEGMEVRETPQTRGLVNPVRSEATPEQGVGTGSIPSVIRKRKLSLGLCEEDNQRARKTSKNKSCLSKASKRKRSDGKGSPTLENRGSRGKTRSASAGHRKSVTKAELQSKKLHSFFTVLSSSNKLT